MRLNKEPPEDAPVVDYVGVLDPTSPSTISPLSSARSHGSALGTRPARGPTPAGGGDAGAGGGGGAGAASAAVAASAAKAQDEEEDDEQAEDLKKIKGEPLGEDDHCVVCLSGEVGRGGKGGGFCIL